jgi:hypothetical protein
MIRNLINKSRQATSVNWRAVCDPRLSAYPEVFGGLFTAVRYYLVANLRALIQTAQPRPLTAKICTNTSLPPLSG